MNYNRQEIGHELPPCMGTGHRLVLATSRHALRNRKPSPTRAISPAPTKCGGFERARPINCVLRVIATFRAPCQSKKCAFPAGHYGGCTDRIRFSIMEC